MQAVRVVGAGSLRIMLCHIVPNAIPPILVVAAGKDADLLVLGEDLSIEPVIARGRLLVEQGRPIVHGRFEPEE